MAKSNYKSRKDSKGRVLHKGEIERKKYNNYAYQYYDMYHVRRIIYASDLPELREKEKEIEADSFEGIDSFAAKNMSFNQAFSNYISLMKPTYKNEHTYNNYIYRYNHYVKNSFGKLKVGKIKYSDIKRFYNEILFEKGYSLNTLETIHITINPVFRLLVRDGIIRYNPATDVMKEMKKVWNGHIKERRALTEQEQRVFLEYTREHPVYMYWLPAYIILLGTGLRIGELVGLRWDDVDMDRRIISVNHQMIYAKNEEKGVYERRITTPKTPNSIRQIPMLEIVYQAFLQQKEYQEQFWKCDVEIDGYKNFIFTSVNKNVCLSKTITERINIICDAYHDQELKLAQEENREPFILPHFSCHSLRHTFCTRLCENEVNVKVIQALMGHSDIKVTLNIYAEVMENKTVETMIDLEGKIKIL